MKFSFGTRSFISFGIMAQLLFLQPPVAMARLGTGAVTSDGREPATSRELLQVDTITAAPAPAVTWPNPPPVPLQVDTITAPPQRLRPKLRPCGREY